MSDLGMCRSCGQERGRYTEFPGVQGSAVCTTCIRAAGRRVAFVADVHQAEHVKQAIRARGCEWCYPGEVHA